MRIDFAADMFGIPVVHLYESLRVLYKRSSDAIGEREYETVGGRTLEYFRYGKSPNCIRVYDKPAECMARFPGLIKHSNREAEPPTFEDLFGFPQGTILARVERQAGGGRLPESLSTFGQLYKASEFNPFEHVHITPNVFPFPDPRRHGVARSLKLVGIHDYIQKFGYQQAYAMLNCEKNAKRTMEDYKQHLEESRAILDLTIEAIVEAYQHSVSWQIDGSIELRTATHVLQPVRDKTLSLSTA